MLTLYYQTDFLLRELDRKRFSGPWSGFANLWVSYLRAQRARANVQSLFRLDQLGHPNAH